MSLPSLAATSGNLVRHGIYIVAQLKADPETAALAKTLEGPQDGLEKEVVARRAADKAAIMASAMADFRMLATQRAIVVFGNKYFGHHASRTAPDYLRVFPQSPSAIAIANPSVRASTWAALRKAATDAQTPKELAPAVKALVAVIDEWTAAEAAAAKASEALKAAGKAEATAADTWQTAVRKLRGELIAVFPRDVKRQRSYLPETKAPRKPKVAPGDSSDGAIKP